MALSLNQINSQFDIFGNPGGSEIKVGYISTEFGYVYDVSICEANDYAQLNPGTVFIVENRDKVEYLTINQVNDLNIIDIEPQDLGNCDKIEFESRCKPPRVEFYGGGGVGVQANPVISRDGQIIALDLVHGGFGYQYAPIVEVTDNCKIGSGAVVRAVLGEVTEGLEVFEDEDDFEEYEICDFEDGGYGRSYGPDGKDLGPWEPGYYTRIGVDPIQREIEIYENIVRSLDRKPFWTSRRKRPNKITSSDPKRILPTTTYDVTFPAWGDFMNSYAVSPVPPSDIVGTDYASVVFTMEWQEDFPIEGEYTFRGLADNIAQLFVDDEKIADLRGFNDNVQSIKKRFSSGIHNIRVDLINAPIENSTVEPQNELVDVVFTVYNQGRNSDAMKANFISEDGKESFTISANKNTRTTVSKTVKVKVGKKYKVIFSSPRGSVEQGRIRKFGVGGRGQELGEGVGTSVFGDHLYSNNDNDDMQITTNLGDFKSFNKRPASGGGRNTYNLTFEVKSEQVSSNTVPKVTKIIEPKPWTGNPMGVSLSIDAPPDPLPPQEIPPEQEGRCPPSPIWTTRFPPTGSIWYPVNFDSPRTEIRTLEVPKNSSDVQEVDFVVYGEGAFNDIYFVFTSVDGKETFTIKGADKNKKRRIEKIKIRKNIKYDVRAIEKSVNHKSVEQGLFADRPNSDGRDSSKFDREIGANKTENKIFADYTDTANDNDDMQITATLGKFTSSNKRKAKNSGRNTYDLTYILEGGPSSSGSDYTTDEVKIPGWSRFMNRYAISPVKPLDTPGSDYSGITFSNYWNINIPYSGFYGVKGTRDNLGRILIDGVEVSKLNNFDVESPDLVKVFIPQGTHIITAEVYNEPIVTGQFSTQGIFSTKEWQISSNDKASVVFTVYNQGRNSDAMKANFISEDGKESFTISANKVTNTTRTQSVNVTIGKKYKVIFSSPRGSVEQGRYVNNKKDRESPEGIGKNIFGDHLYSDNDNDDMQITTNLGDFKSFNKRPASGGGRNTYNLTFEVKSEQVSSNVIKSGTVRNGVTYNGPDMFYYKHLDWGDFMRENSVSPYIVPIDGDSKDNVGTKIFTWSGVNFPEDGEYKIKLQGDNIAKLEIGGASVKTSTDFKEKDPPFTYFYLTKGVKDIKVTLTNQSQKNNSNNNIFKFNPSGFSLIVEKDILLERSDQTPWSTNPIGISAVLIPPPCPKLRRGRGVVVDLEVEDPGNNYIPPPDDPVSGVSTSYTVLTVLKDVPVVNPGINYRCGEDPIKIIPDNGTVLTYTCDTFGRIETVGILTSKPFETVPIVYIESETGVNATFAPQLEVIRDPILLQDSGLRESLIQVTDLVGLKQNGYIDGRAYYGSVFYMDGVRYAGVYETVGELVRVYDTLKESIDAKVTSRPNAIQRSGTDTELSSNNRILDIPNTPQNLI